MRDNYIKVFSDIVEKAYEDGRKIGSVVEELAAVAKENAWPDSIAGIYKKSLYAAAKEFLDIASGDDALLGYVDADFNNVSITSKRIVSEAELLVSKALE